MDEITKLLESPEETRVCIFPDQFIYMDNSENQQGNTALLAMGIRTPNILEYAAPKTKEVPQQCRYFVKEGTISVLTDDRIGPHS